MASGVVHSDLELYLTSRLARDLATRPEEACQGVQVDRREPSPAEAFPRRLVVIRDDSGPDTSVVSAQRSVGMSFLADEQTDCMTLSLIGAALAAQVPGIDAGNPVASVVPGTIFGPYWVAEDQPRFRRYMTITYDVVGEPL